MKKKLLFSSVLLLGAVTALAGGAMASKAVAPAAAYYAGEEETFRIWLNRNGQYEWSNIADPDKWVDDEYTWGVNIDGLETIFPGRINVQWNGTMNLLYFDLPVSVIGGTFSFSPYLESDHSQIVNDVVIDVDYASGDNAKVYYLYWDDTTKGFNYSQGSANKDGNEYALRPEAFGKVLEAYYTCSDSKDNGYGNFKTLSETWYQRADGTYEIGGELGGQTISDYAYGDGKYDYATGEKTETVDLWTKYSAMMANYNAMATPSSAFLGMAGGNFEAAVVALSGLTVVGLGGGALYLAKRRKKA